MTAITHAINALDADALSSAITEAELDGRTVESLLAETTCALTDLLENS